VSPETVEQELGDALIDGNLLKLSGVQQPGYPVPARPPCHWVLDSSNTATAAAGDEG